MKNINSRPALPLLVQLLIGTNGTCSRKMLATVIIKICNIITTWDAIQLCAFQILQPCEQVKAMGQVSEKIKIKLPVVVCIYIYIYTLS